jgi:cysteinyl-tRNA synthetase
MKIYNTLTRQKEEFQPGGDPVTMYVCGVTPYDSCHLGHAMSYIVFDVIRRYLEYRGYRVRHIQNFTDVDDKIILRARERGISPQELAEKYIAEYFEDMDALNIQRAHLYPRATQEIPKIIEVISGLIEKGHAYQARGDVYYRVQSKPDYGKLSRRTLEGMMSGARIEPGEAKEHPMDFTLWKAAKPGEPQWPSPWGPGRPGWHIECSAMSLKYLGQSLDIHGGGQDLIFPHHENEIAQSESFVRYWLHNGLVQLSGEKMSKSLGNLIPVKEALRDYGTDTLRLFVLASHYHSPLTYSKDGLEAMQRAAERLRFAARGQGYGEGPAPEGEAYRQQFIEAMADDFNTARALSVLFDLARDINRAQGGEGVEGARQVLRELAGVLGLTLKEREHQDLPVAQPFIELLIKTRAELRAQKQWALADKIRAGLAEQGIILEDTPQGTVWRYQG